MQVRGGTLQGLGAGQVFYESPKDVHTVSRNASKTKPAKFVVSFIKNEGAPILTPAPLASGVVDRSSPVKTSCLKQLLAWR
jgi:hypothetical protein